MTIVLHIDSGRKWSVYTSNYSPLICGWVATFFRYTQKDSFVHCISLNRMSKVLRHSELWPMSSSRVFFGLQIFFSRNVSRKRERERKVLPKFFAVGTALRLRANSSSGHLHNCTWPDALLLCASGAFYLRPVAHVICSLRHFALVVNTLTSPHLIVFLVPFPQICLFIAFSNKMISCNLLNLFVGWTLTNKFG